MPTTPLTAEEIAKLRRLATTAREEYDAGYEKAYKNIPDLCDALPRLLDERDRLLAEVREWLCESCRTVYPGPPQTGFSCVICPKCDGLTGPRVSIEKRAAEAQVERSRALLKRIEWAAMDLAEDPHCPECGGPEPIQVRHLGLRDWEEGHLEGCELSALLGQTKSAATPEGSGA